MKKKINLEKILQDFGIYNNSTHPNEEIHEKYLIIVAAMKEACRQTLELAAENAKVTSEKSEIPNKMRIPVNKTLSINFIVNKQSILDTIKQIE